MHVSAIILTQHFSFLHLRLFNFVTLHIITLYIKNVLKNMTNLLADVLAGQVVWITGASGGIGEALAYALGAAGCRLVLSARREHELLRVKQNCLGTGLFLAPIGPKAQVHNHHGFNQKRRVPDDYQKHGSLGLSATKQGPIQVQYLL